MADSIQTAPGEKPFRVVMFADFICPIGVMYHHDRPAQQMRHLAARGGAEFAQSNRGDDLMALWSPSKAWRRGEQRQGDEK